MSFDILRGTPEHASVLTDITIAAKRHWNYPEKWMEQWLPELTISSEYISENEIWMAVRDKKPVAYYSLQTSRHCEPPPLFFGGEAIPNTAMRLVRREEHPPRNDGSNLWLDNLWVLPEYMGQGIGKQLFQHALERSRLRGVSILKIEADPNAQGFYEKMGARKVGEHHHAEMDGQPRILPVMEMDL